MDERLQRSQSCFIEQLLNNQIPQYPVLNLPIEELVWKGGFPVIAHHEKENELNQWRESYIQTYLERDLRQLSQIENLPDFRRVMIAAALRSGNILNTANLAQDLGLSQATVYRYLRILELSLLVERLPVYAANKNIRVIKSPKLMWADSGLVTYLSGIYSAKDIRNDSQWGGLLETYIYMQLRSAAQMITPKPSIFYWRTQQGKEIDFIVQYGRRVIAFEVKSSSKISIADTKTMQYFLANYPEAAKGIMVYTGTEIQQITPQIIALPIEFL